jgi:hypothetical protein
MKLVLMLILTAVSCFAQSSPHRHPRLWAWSVVLMSASTTGDAVTSWHQPESNPLLGDRGKFDGKSLSIKIGATAGMVAIEMLIRRKRDDRNMSAIMNLSATGIFTGAAIHNELIRK